MALFDFKNEQGHWIIDPEFFRLIGYVSFWFMMGVSMLVTKMYVTIPSPNPLELIFGYTNICIYFDYDPSRVIAAMIYPLVEYSMVAYVATNWYTARHVFQRHSSWLYQMFTFATVLEIIFTAWFRLVFVMSALNNPLGHTLPFQGLQVTLALIAIQNTTYYNLLHETKWKFLGWMGNWREHLGTIGWIYTGLLLFVTAVKLTVVTLIFAGHPIFPIDSDAQKSFGSFFDTAWMILAAIIPLFISIYMMYQQDRPKLTINPTSNLYQEIP